MVAATFDSPDRIYNSGLHLMELSARRSEASVRERLCRVRTVALKANEPIKTTVTIIGGKGDSIVPAVKDYLALRPLPNLPKVKGGFSGRSTCWPTAGWIRRPTWAGCSGMRCGAAVSRRSLRRMRRFT